MKRLNRTLKRGNTPVLVLAITTGALVALLVAGFEVITDRVLLDRINERPLWQIALAPAIGLSAAAVILRVIGRGTASATSDEFVRAFHQRTPRLPLRELPAKLLAGMATIGSGGALGLEGPSIYAGSATGLAVSERFRQWLRREDVQVLLTAGAAAGVAAVFKAPATGVLFALEAPYRDDVNRRALLPSLLAAATSYVVYINMVGAEAVVPFLNDPEIRLGLDLTNIHLANDSTLALFDASKLTDFFTGVQAGDLVGALILGVLAGLGGRAMAWLVRWSKGQARQTSFVPLSLIHI